ncbi:DNA polymerase I A, chloroplastic-like [Hordeum vulgare subsp. vulgare]|uniref:DNA-directed DNA polymerase n=1 Tax=Hordeum vulgare subsp. vulgare TaxID=112509 RepID=A0A8I6WZC1_HORVV|nr:DNA polymerase I A, chloroplastic-like [Hordeum vulgare subsp. vulgare]
MAAPAPVPAQLRRCPCSAPLWTLSPLLRHHRRASHFLGGRRQGYSHSSGLGINDNSALRPGVYFNFNVESSAQEWKEESKRICSIKTTNAVMNNVYNGYALRPGNLHHDPLEDYKSSNQSPLYGVRERMAPNSLANRHTNMELAKQHVLSPTAGAVSALTSVVDYDIKPLNRSSDSEVEIQWPNGSKIDASLSNIRQVKKGLQFDGKADGYDEVEHECTAKTVVNDDIKLPNRPSGSEVEMHWPNGSEIDDSLLNTGKVKKSPKIRKVKKIPQFDDLAIDGYNGAEHECTAKTAVQPPPAKAPLSEEAKDARKALATIYDKVLVVDTVESARSVVQLLTTKYKSFIHACDTEVSNIDVKQETPVGHGDVTCFSIYSASSDAEADFGNGKTCIWVDVLDGGRDVLMEFVPFFEDSAIRKVWHNYSFDKHVIENYGIKVAGFHADTMHLARLWDSSRRLDGGYSLEGLTNDSRVMGVVPKELQKIGKRSMKTIFGRKKIKKDGSEGKITTIESVEILQREDRELWISYSSLDSMSTLRLYESLKSKLEKKHWTFDGCPRGSLYDFYEEYWRPFGAILVKMETAGMLVDRSYLSEIEKVAVAQRKVAADKFQKWASKYCPDAKYMNVNSDTQIRQLFFGGIENRRNPGEFLPKSRTLKVPNNVNTVTEGKKAPKHRTIEICSIVEGLKPEIFTASGWPSVSGDALRSLAGKLKTDLYTTEDAEDDEYVSDSEISVDVVEDTTSYGTAYKAFGGGKEGKEACYAIAALCEICSIDSLISNFILPLQGNRISCKEGRIHCSLNINTETGRLSARAPNLQNQPALEKDRYKIRQAFVAAPGNSLIVADYGQLELRILAHLANCKSMLDAFKAGGDFHSRTAMNMYQHIRDAVEEKRVLLEWDPQPGQEKPPVPMLKDAFGSERRKAKMLNFSIAYGKTAAGLARDWKVSRREAEDTLDLWYSDRKEVLAWQTEQKELAYEKSEVYTLLGRSRRFPSISSVTSKTWKHIERAAINAPVQGSAADVAMCAMIEIERNTRLKELGWTLLLQVHDEVILEGPSESADVAKAIVVECMSKPFYGTNILSVDLAVDAKCAQNWFAAK